MEGIQYMVEKIIELTLDLERSRVENRSLQAELVKGRWIVEDLEREKLLLEQLAHEKAGELLKKEQMIEGVLKGDFIRLAVPGRSTANEKAPHALWVREFSVTPLSLLDLSRIINEGGNIIIRREGLVTEPHPRYISGANGIEL